MLVHNTDGARVHRFSLPALQLVPLQAIAPGQRQGRFPRQSFTTWRIRSQQQEHSLALAGTAEQEMERPPAGKKTHLVSAKVSV